MATHETTTSEPRAFARRARKCESTGHQGDLVWIQRCDVHGGRLIGDQQLRIRSILIPQSFVAGIFTHSSNDDEHFDSRLIRDPILSEQFLDLHNAAEPPSDIFEIRNRLVEILSLLLSRDLNGHIAVQDRKEHKSVQMVKEYFAAHYAELISIHHLAELSGLSTPYLVRVFRSEVGLPPYAYLTQLRIARARMLLSAGMTPADVAASVGLSDQSHLIRFFKRSTGMTPASYGVQGRSLHKSNDTLPTDTNSES